MNNATMRIVSLVGMSVVALATTPAAGAEPPPDRKDYPLAEGNYTTAADPGWVYFVVDFPMKPDQHEFFGCGMGPDGTVGCDRVPRPDKYPGMTFVTYPPAGSNQTFATASEAASYRFSFTPTFSRDVAVLPEGRRLVNGGAKCQRGYQGSMSCRTGEHGFQLSYASGMNW